MSTNTPNVINQYLQFAADVNNNVASAIQLLNHLRFSVSDIVNRHAALAVNPSPIRRPLNLPVIGLGGTLSERLGGNSRSRRTSLIRPRRQFSARSSQTSRVGEGTYRRTFSGIRPPGNWVVDNATSICRFSDLSTNYIMCPIRQTRFDASDNIMKIRHCGHIFLEDALREWFRTSSECPVCRHNINPPRTPLRSVSRNINASTEELRESLQHLINFADASNNRILDSSGAFAGGGIDTAGNPLLFLEYSFPLTLT